MNKINVCFMSDECLETLRKNSTEVVKRLKANNGNSKWISEIYPGEIWEQKKYKIPEITLNLSTTGNYSDVDYGNSVMIYEVLKDLPRYILTDERFWAWFNFTIGYQAALQAMEIKSESTFKDHWLFTQGQRRGLFFGVMSRCFFRVALSVDEEAEDKYVITRWVIKNPERIRNLTWRASSSEKHITLGALKAEMAVSDAVGASKVSNKIYPIIAKYISNYASVRLIDVISEKEIYRIVYDKMMELLDTVKD